MESLGGMVGDGDVVGVAVQPVGAEGQHHLGAEAAYLQHQAFHHLGGAGVDEGPRMIVCFPALHPRVAVAPYVVTVQAQGADGAGKLHPANLPQRLPGRRPLLTDFALLPQRGGEQAHVHTPARVSRQRTTNRERLVVGVGKAGQQSVFGHFNLPSVL